MDFSESLVGEVKLMPDKVLQLLRRYLLSLLSYRENKGGGNINPSSSARVNPHKYLLPVTALGNQCRTELGK